MGRKASSLDAFEERVKRFVKGTKKTDRYLCANRILSRFDPERLPYKTITNAISEELLEQEDGSGALAIAPALRQGLGPKTMQEAVKLFRELLSLQGIARGSGESMKVWTARFQQYIDRVGTVLHAAEPEMDRKTFLHPVLQGIILITASGLEPSEVAAVLATSGNPDDELSSRQKNSHHVEHLIASMCDQWSDESIQRRDAQNRKSRAQANALTDMVAMTEALVEMETDASQTGASYDSEPTYAAIGDDTYDPQPHEDQGTGLETVDEGIAEDHAYFEEQFGSIEDAESYAADAYASAAGSFQEARELVSWLKTARGYFPVVGIAAYDELLQPTSSQSAPLGRARGKSAGRGIYGRGKDRGGSSPSAASQSRVAPPP